MHTYTHKYTRIHASVQHTKGLSDAGPLLPVHMGRGTEQRQTSRDAC